MYDKFKVYLLLIFINLILKTRVRICILYSISYLFTVKEKRPKNDI
jgi:hypothetical protein